MDFYNNYLILYNNFKYLIGYNEYLNDNNFIKIIIFIQNINMYKKLHMNYNYNVIIEKSNKYIINKYNTFDIIFLNNIKKIHKYQKYYDNDVDYNKFYNLFMLKIYNYKLYIYDIIDKYYDEYNKINFIIKKKINNMNIYKYNIFNIKDLNNILYNYNNKKNYKDMFFNIKKIYYKNNYSNKNYYIIYNSNIIVKRNDNKHIYKPNISRKILKLNINFEETYNNYIDNYINYKKIYKIYINNNVIIYKYSSFKNNNYNYIIYFNKNNYYVKYNIKYTFFKYTKIYFKLKSSINNLTKKINRIKTFYNNKLLYVI